MSDTVVTCCSVGVQMPRLGVLERRSQGLAGTTSWASGWPWSGLQALGARTPILHLGLGVNSQEPPPCPQLPPQTAWVSCVPAARPPLAPWFHLRQGRGPRRGFLCGPCFSDEVNVVHVISSCFSHIQSTESTPLPPPLSTEKQLVYSMGRGVAINRVCGEPEFSCRFS